MLEELVVDSRAITMKPLFIGPSILFNILSLITMNSFNTSAAALLFILSSVITHLQQGRFIGSPPFIEEEESQIETGFILVWKCLQIILSSGAVINLILAAKGRR